MTKGLIVLFIMLSFPSGVHAQERSFKDAKSLLLGPPITKSSLVVSQSKATNTSEVVISYRSSVGSLEFHGNPRDNVVTSISVLGTVIPIPQIHMIHSKEADLDSKEIEIEFVPDVEASENLQEFSCSGRKYLSTVLGLPNGHEQLVLIFDITDKGSATGFGYYSWYHFDHPLISRLPTGHLAITRLYENGGSEDWRTNSQIEGEVFEYLNGDFKRIRTFGVGK